MIGLVGICDIRSARMMTRVAKDTKIVNGTKRAMRSVARLSVAPVSLGRTERKDLRTKKVSARPAGGTHRGSVARRGVSPFGSMCYLAEADIVCAGGRLTRRGKTRLHSRSPSSSAEIHSSAI